MKIWQRFLFFRLAAVFLFILIALFAVYLFIDLSVHHLKFKQGGYGAPAILLYYIHSFSELIDLFVPFAFLLACLKVLSGLTTHLEILSLQMARLSTKKILAPFFLFAALLSTLSFCNHEWLAPRAALYIKKFKMSHLAKQREANEKQVLHTLLADGSILIYHHLNQEKKEAKDLFWIRSLTDIWHIKTLSFASTPPIGSFSDHFTLQAEKLSKAESFDRRLFPEIPLQGKLAETILFPLESKALSSLFKQRQGSAAIRTHLHHKLMMPLFPFLILFAVAPLTLKHRRDRRLFPTICFSVLAFIIAMILCDTFLLLGVNGVVEPWIAIWALPFFLFFFTGKKFARIG